MALITRLGNLNLRETFPFIVSATENTTVEHLVGKPKPSFVFINNDDNAFAKCFLDADVMCSSWHLANFL